jgi:hypothetical protein
MNLHPQFLHLFEFVVVFGVLISLFTLLRRKRRTIGYLLNVSLVSPAERSFLGCLESVLTPDTRILIKVRLADLFSVENTDDHSAWQTAFNRIQSKHVDFLLCRSTDLSPVLAIELDDKSHSRGERQERDHFLDALFSNSGIHLLRVPARRTYDARDLARKLDTAVKDR